MELAAPEKSDGPLVTQLDKSLKEINVERQAYHGKSFIGNHVHTCCKVYQYLSHEEKKITCFGVALTDISFSIFSFFCLTGKQ